MLRNPVALIDMAALRHNLRVCRHHAKGRRITAVIKANAYGHGLIEAARALKEADAFGLCSYHEACELRRHGIEQPLLLLEGFHAEEEILAERDPTLEWVIHHPHQLIALNRLPASSRTPIWLKIDSGMGRLGFRSESVKEVYNQLQSLGDRIHFKGFITHLACADEPTHPMTKMQLERFEAATASYSGARSIANSAAILAWPEIEADDVRAGIMLYGVSPFADDCGRDHQLKPVMTFKSRLIAIKKGYQGDAIGYGATYRLPHDALIGIVAAGYGDGYPRHLSKDACVLIRGVKVPIIGRVTMDMIAVRLDALKEAEIDDEVILWGEGLPVEEVARWSGTIPYELLCQVTGRVKREILHG